MRQDKQNTGPQWRIFSVLWSCVGMWLFITARRRALFEKRMQAARRNTAEKYKRVLEVLQQYAYEDELILAQQKRRRKIILHLLQRQRRRPTVRALNRPNHAAVRGAEEEGCRDPSEHVSAEVTCRRQLWSPVNVQNSSKSEVFQKRTI